MKKGAFAEAVSHLQEVLRSDSKDLPAHLALAKIYIQTRQTALARQHLSAVLAISPGHPEATAMWQQTGS